MKVVNLTIDISAFAFSNNQASWTDITNADVQKELYKKRSQREVENIKCLKVKVGNNTYFTKAFDYDETRGLLSGFCVFEASSATLVRVVMKGNQYSSKRT